MNSSLAHLCVDINSGVKEVSQAMSSRTPSGETYGIAFVTNDFGRICGVVSDSDLRKYIAQHGELPSNIQKLIQRDFVSIELDSELSHSEFVNSLRSQIGKTFKTSISPIRYIPVTSEGKLHSIIDLRALKLDGLDTLDEVFVIGLGYVGITLACYLSSKGKKVSGIDTSTSQINRLKSGKIAIHEPGLAEVLESGLSEGTLTFRTNLKELETGKGTCYFFICVPTPVDDAGIANLSFVETAAIEVGRYLKKGDVVFLRSTVPVGTTRAIAEMLAKHASLTPGIDFTCCYAPERTIEGKAFEELGGLPQIVGGLTPNCQKLGSAFFESLGNNVVPVSSTESAEIVKIASNSYRDYVFGFSNSLAIMATSWNLDVNEIINASNFGYPRNQIPQPSPGVGGPCLSKDPYLMQNQSLKVLGNIYHSRKINEQMPEILARRAVKAWQSLGKEPKNKVLLVGMAFKGTPPTNDLRNSPSSSVQEYLMASGMIVDTWDAVISDSIIPNSDYGMYIIMNNHESNSALVLESLKSNKQEFVCIVDPWLLLNKSVLFSLSPGGRFIYLTLSQEISI